MGWVVMGFLADRAQTDKLGLMDGTPSSSSLRKFLGLFVVDAKTLESPMMMMMTTGSVFGRRRRSRPGA